MVVGAVVGLAVAAGFGVAVADGLEVGFAVGAAVGFTVGFGVAVAEGFAVALLPEEGLLVVLLPELGFVVADGFAVALGFDTVLPGRTRGRRLTRCAVLRFRRGRRAASLRALGFAAFRFCARRRRRLCTCSA